MLVSELLKYVNTAEDHRYVFVNSHLDCPFIKDYEEYYFIWFYNMSIGLKTIKEFREELKKLDQEKEIKGAGGHELRKIYLGKINIPINMSDPVRYIKFGLFIENDLFFEKNGIKFIEAFLLEDPY